ncbi:hypothetical protein BX666DRAFT_1915191 [Dichotomocladium elegans]|nr:hypothetical protein BX666DRAFT_1915191 [Dichotomocladium elegans]
MSLPLCLRRPVSALYAKSQTDICRVLLNQLITLIPGIDQCVDTGIDITQDPVNMLLAICREGSGLCLLFNAAKPDSPIGHSADSDMFPLQQFLKACESQLDLQPSDLFTIDDLEHGLPVQV